MRLLVLFLELKTAFLLCKRLHNICLRYIFRYFNQKGLKQLHFYGNIVTELSHVIQERDEGPKTLSPGLCPMYNDRSPYKQHALDQRSPTEGKGKGQKFLEAARPERAEALSPGQRPGLFRAQTCRPVRAKALKLQAIYKAVALTGRIADCH